MKANPIPLLGLILLAHTPLHAQIGTNFLIQTQFPSGAMYTVFVDKMGNQPSEMPIDPGGARFELWTVWPDATGALRDFPIGNAYVGAEKPVATLEIISKDKTLETGEPGAEPLAYRTRVDHPFDVNVQAEGFSLDPEASIAARRVNFHHTLRAYGEDGDGTDIDRTVAPITAFSNPYVGLTADQASLSFTSSPRDESALFVAPGDWTTARGEQTLSVWSQTDPDTGVLVSEQLTSRTIQVWPMAEGTLAGITNGQKIKFRMPPITLTLSELYPSSTTYVRAIHGNDVANARVVPGSALALTEPAPVSRILVVDKYDAILDQDGTWTFELVTDTPFGRAEYLDHVTFEFNRSLDVKGSITTLE